MDDLEPSEGKRGWLNRPTIGRGVMLQKELDTPDEHLPYSGC